VSPLRWPWVRRPATGRRGLALLLVGFGVRGRQWAQAVARHPGVDLVGVVDPGPAVPPAGAAARAPAWPSLDAALAGARAEAAVIASPPLLHAEQATRCLQAGLAVLVEKPLAASFPAARALAAIARASRPLLVGQSFRFLARSRAVERALSAGWIGAVRADLVATTRAAPPALAALGLEHAPLWDFAVHHFDLARRRFGGIPGQVEATARPAAGRAGEGGVRYAIEFAWDDGRAFTYLHREGPPFFHHHEWLEGEDGGLCVEDRGVTLVTTRHRPRRVRPRRGPSPERALLDALVVAARGGHASSLDADENLGTIAMVDAALLALRQQRTVTLAEIIGAAGLDPGPAAGRG
jgi:predicted dehydrogenase